MTNNNMLHFDGRMKVKRTQHVNFDSVSIEDYSWDPKTRCRTGSELTLMISHDAGHIKALDDLITQLQAVRYKILPNCISCQGTGTWTQEVNDQWHEEPYLAHEPCPDCQGEGKVYPSESTAA